MAPIKFEEQLKDKLEKRNLSPSADGWTKLSERLDAEEQKSKNPWFWWMGIAASLIIMLAIAVQTFGSKDIEDITPQLVEDESIENKIEELQPNLNNTKAVELAVEDNHSKKDEVNNEANEQPKIINYKSVTNKKPKAKSQLAAASINEKTNAEEYNKEKKEQPILIHQPEIKENAVAKTIKEFKGENRTVTDREVDSLLKLASKELFKDKLQKETIKTVDANTLLQDVEEEMGQSFRSKVFDALKDSYETVKTAVAERNN